MSDQQAFQVSRFSEFAAMFAEAEANARELAEARIKINTLEAAINAKDRVVYDLQSENASLRDSMTEVVRERDMFRDQYRDADAALNTARGDLDASQALLGESQAEVARLRDEVNTWRLKYEDAGRTIIELEAELKTANDAIAKITETVMGFTKPEWTHPSAPMPAQEVPQGDPTSEYGGTSSSETSSDACRPPEVAQVNPTPEAAVGEYPSLPSEAPKVLPGVEQDGGTRLGTEGHSTDELSWPVRHQIY